jgi:multimeric flavodoxin WrbA
LDQPGKAMILTAVALNATLKPTDSSSTQKMIDLVLDAMKEQGVDGVTVRLTQFDVRPGVSSNEGSGDDWPTIREHILAADILVMAPPIWMDQPSSVCKRALERIWTLFWMKPMIKAVWFLTARLLRSPSLATKMVHIMYRPNSTRL